MKNILPIKERLEKKYAKQFCNIDDISKCIKEHCECRIAAEIKSYMLAIIPRPYFNFTIWDFTGIALGQQLLDNKILKVSKEKLIDYCWEGITLEKIAKITNKNELDIYSSINKRRKLGQNVVIYSPLMQDGIFKNKPTGKTMVASILMREAIKLRSIAGHMADTYCWQKFAILQDIMKKDDPEAMDIKTCDWLVIDDIANDYVSMKGLSYLKSLIDPVFIDRYDNNLPTILVFDFDIEMQGIDWKNKFGSGIYHIVHDSNTCRIKLA